MKNIIFVAPYFLPATVRFIDSVASLQGVRVGLISKDPPGMLPQAVRRKLADHCGVVDGMDTQQILDAARVLIQRMGMAYRLFGPLEDLQVPLAMIREKLGIAGMSVDSARNFRDKSRMKQVMGEAGIPCARHKLVRSKQEALEFARTGFPLVAKPPAGAGARQTLELHSTQDLTAHLDTVGDQPVLLEEFIQGREFTFDSVHIGGKMVWHAMAHYLPSPLEVLKNPWIQWCVLLPREPGGSEFDDIREAAMRAHQALGMSTGLSHMEWFRRPDGRFAISEVAARPPGAQITSLHSYSHDFDLFRAWSELMVFERFEVPTRRHAAGVAFLRGMGQGRVKAVHGLQEAQCAVGSLVIETKLPHAGQPSGRSYEGQGYVIVRHRETEQVKRALDILIRSIRVEIA